MAHNSLTWLEAIPKGTKIKSWSIDELLSTGTACHMYTAYNKDEGAVLKYVSVFISNETYV